MNRIIHYCWFGKSPMPEKLLKCVKTWSQQMPKWEIVRWDENSFDVDSNNWTSEAYKAKKYAFVSDYVRLEALYKYGGIYLDTDVKLLSSLEPLVNDYEAFGGFESYNKLTSAVIAAPPGHPLIRQFLEYYFDKRFTSEVVATNEANVLMMTHICKKHGLIANGEEQTIDICDESGTRQGSFHIFPQTYFCPLDFYHNKKFSDLTHAVHLFEASWLDYEVKKRVVYERSVFYKVISSIRSYVSHKLKQYKV